METLGPTIVVFMLLAVVLLYFRYNPKQHASPFMWRRFWNWFPLGMSYAFLYMARYNINVAKVFLGTKMSIASFGTIFAAGTFAYAFSLVFNGPFVDKIGSRNGIVLATVGAAFCNIAMGIAVYLLMHDQLTMNMTVLLSILYAGNMYFQSYGAVSIIKNKAYWFHVRERGIFGAIFGTLISVGIYFAFDWNSKIADASKVEPKDPGLTSSFFKSVFNTGADGVDAVWMIFFIPSAILLTIGLVDFFLVKDMPSQAGHEDFDTHDASSGQMDKEFRKREMLKAVFTHPVIMLVGFIELTNGVIRNGIMQWYFVFANAVPQVGAEWFKDNWGFILCVSGIAGGFLIGQISDRVFHSRRGPPVVIVSVISLVTAMVMFSSILTGPVIVGFCAVILGLLSVAVHSMMSGTAAADFGGRKMTATAAGVADAFVYIGSGIQSVVLGILLKDGATDHTVWKYWPAFIIPFALITALLALRMWKALPDATKKYLETTEKVKI